MTRKQVVVLGPQDHLTKLAFEKYLLRKSRHGYRARQREAIACHRSQSGPRATVEADRSG